MKRRTLLTAVGVGSLSIAGCIASELTGREDLPDDCPISQNVGVEWPSNLDESTVAMFIERYEEAYYRLQVIDTKFEPESRLFEYSGWISRIENVTAVEGGGWRVHFSGIVNVQRGDLLLEATVSDPPDDVRVVSADDVDDERLRDVLEGAAETGQAGDWIEPAESNAYLELFESLSNEFDVHEVGDEGTLYFDVNGTTVELVVSASPPNRDHFWDAWYYVDDDVVWRSGEHDVDPRDGELLECRTPS